MKFVSSITLLLFGIAVCSASVAATKDDRKGNHQQKSNGHLRALFEPVEAWLAVDTAPEIGNVGTQDSTQDQDDDCMSITDTICKMGPAFSVMCNVTKDDALSAAMSLVDNDSDNDNDNAASTNWTVFVPTDDAFEDASPVLKAITDEEEMRVLLFHFYKNYYLTYDELVCRETIQSVLDHTQNHNDDEQPNGPDESRTKCDKGYGKDVKFQTGNGNTKQGSLPKIVDSDIHACNGIIHVLDHVMYPVALSELMTQGHNVTDVNDKDKSTDPAVSEDDLDFSVFTGWG
jgi:uncharacterized surface protein with fasciclin (FAS1) repeats